MSRNTFKRVLPGTLDGETLGKIVELLEGSLLEESDTTLETIVVDVFSGQTQLWEVNDYQAIVITAVVKRPRFSVLYVEWMAGKGLMDWIDNWIETQMSYAKERGCRKIQFSTKRNCEKLQERLKTGFKLNSLSYRQDVV